METTQQPASNAVLRAFLWVPKRLRREFQTRGSDARFLMWISFLLAFTWARTWVLYFNKRSPNITVEDHFQIGEKIVILGYHPHHIALGILLLAIAGWLGIHYQGKQLTRIAALLYGGGLGLIVDEVAFIVEGITYRQDIPEVFVLIVVISALMMSSVYAPGFMLSLELRARGLWARVQRARPKREGGQRNPPVPPASPLSSPSEGQPTEAPSGERPQ